MVKRSFTILAWNAWVTVFLCSEEVHNAYVPVHGSTVKWSVFFVIYTQWITDLLVNQIFDYVLMTKKSSMVKRSFAMLT